MSCKMEIILSSASYTFCFFIARTFLSGYPSHALYSVAATRTVAARTVALIGGQAHSYWYKISKKNAHCIHFSWFYFPALPKLWHPVLCPQPNRSSPHPARIIPSSNRNGTPALAYLLITLPRSIRRHRMYIPKFRTHILELRMYIPSFRTKPPKVARGQADTPMGRAPTYIIIGVNRPGAITTIGYVQGKKNLAAR